MSVAQGLHFPPEAGYPFDSHKDRFYLLESHYSSGSIDNNGDIIDGSSSSSANFVGAFASASSSHIPMDLATAYAAEPLLDSSGLRLYVTPVLRPHDAGVMSIGECKKRGKNKTNTHNPDTETDPSCDKTLGECFLDCIEGAVPDPIVCWIAGVLFCVLRAAYSILLATHNASSARRWYAFSHTCWLAIQFGSRAFLPQSQSSRPARATTSKRMPGTVGFFY